VSISCREDSVSDITVVNWPWSSRDRNHWTTTATTYLWKSL